MSKVKSALVVLAPGAEEMEVTITVDVLRRGGVKVTLAGLDGVAAVTCSRGVRILPDAALDAVEEDFDIVILPGGGPGSERLAASAEVGALLTQQLARGGSIGAICAAPTALARHGIALGSNVTAYPSVRPSLEGSYQTSDERVVEAGPLITSQGPGTSFEFALAIVERLRGEEIASEVRAALLLP